MGRVRRSRRVVGISSLVFVALVAAITPASAEPSAISLSPTRGPVGANVTITGTGLLLTTDVLFGSVHASFQVDSDEQVTATVPPTAVTAPVEVHTLDGSVTSEEPFVVQPNIVVILTDDQRWDTLSFMPNVQSDLVDHGITFRNAFAENPLCCPSRVSFLTGNSSHTTGIYGNQSPHGGFSDFDDRATLATWLHDVGYHTLLVGKYLNHYDVTGGMYVPPGWARWRAFASPAHYFTYKLSVDGTAAESYGNAPEDYSTDIIASIAEDEIRSASPQDPLFLWVAPYAPHGPFTPAPRDVGSLNGIEPWRPPSFDEPDVRDKPTYIQEQPRLSSAQVAELDVLRQDQLESLGAVDDAVGALTLALRDTGRLSDTIFVYSSDNGYLWGEHRHKGKVVPYEESIRIPLVIRWDRLTASRRIDTHLVENIDLTPTLVDAASANGGPFDGRSLMPIVADGSTSWRTHMLIEHDGAVEGDVPPYCADRTPKEIFVHYATGEEEYYRLKADPYQTSNKIGAAKLQTRIATLRNRLRTMCSPLPPHMPAF